MGRLHFKGSKFNKNCLEALRTLISQPRIKRSL